MAYVTGSLKSSKSGNFRFSLILAMFGVLASSEALAHGGGLNAQGCHNNRKTGDYHCHRAQQVALASANQLVRDEPDARIKSEQQATQAQAHDFQKNVPGKPTCHVGPRGGTYTITSSGRKNYSGC
ncbi:MAG: YHYH domain-containing protein [Telluria sp.]